MSPITFFKISFVTFLLSTFLNSDLLRIGERNGSDSAPSLFFKSTKNSSLIMDALQTDREKHKQASPQKQVQLVDGRVTYLSTVLKVEL